MALKAWEASVKASTSLAGSFRPEKDYRQEEQAVNAASVALEEYHFKLGKSLQDGVTKGNQLLKTLERVSPWDAKRIQELLRLRADYFLDSKWDTESLRFTAARRFLDLAPRNWLQMARKRSSQVVVWLMNCTTEVPHKSRWPEAEVYALRWPENLDRMLGSHGREAWLARATQLNKEKLLTG